MPWRAGELGATRSQLLGFIQQILSTYQVPGWGVSTERGEYKRINMELNTKESTRNSGRGGGGTGTAISVIHEERKLR